MTPLENLILVIGLAFVVLVIFLAKFLYTSCKTLQKVTQTLEAVQKQVDDLGHEPRDILHHTNEIALDIQTKMKCINPLFRALSNIGEGLEHKTAMHRGICVCRCCKAELDASDVVEENTVTQCIHLALLGARILQDLKTRR